MKLLKFNIIIILLLNILLLSSCNKNESFGKIITYEYDKSFGMNFRNISDSKKLDPPISIDILVPNIFLKNFVQSNDPVLKNVKWNDMYTDEKKSFTYIMKFSPLYEVNKSFSAEEIWIEHKGHIYGVDNIEDILKNNKIIIGINENGCKYIMHTSIIESSFVEIYIEVKEKFYFGIDLDIGSENIKYIQDIINSIKILGV